jgi:uncharacterized protein YjiS (DUF1127 family)
MSTCEFAPETARITIRPAVTTRVWNGTVGLFRAWRNRLAFRRLGELTDAELADIGLTRGDLRVATDVPFGADPTVKLHSLVRQRAATAADLARMVG